MRKLLMAFVLSMCFVILLSFTAFAAEFRYVIADYLNVRSEPSTESDILGGLPQGDLVEVVEFTNPTWVKIKIYGGKHGYVARQYLGTRRIIASRSGSTAVRSATNNSDVIEYAKKFLGVPYAYGGNGPNSFDCSGFAKYVYSNFGVNLSRTTYSQVSEGTHVNRSDLQAGDLVFFAPGSSVSHVGIYISNGQFIHSPQTGDVVKISSMNDGYYNTNYYTARRVR